MLYQNFFNHGCFVSFNTWRQLFFHSLFEEGLVDFVSSSQKNGSIQVFMWFKPNPPLNSCYQFGLSQGCPLTVEEEEAQILGSLKS